MPKKRFAIQDNYLLYYADSGQAMPTSVYARRNTVFNYSPTEFEIKEFFDNASVKVTIAELNAGNVVDDTLATFTVNSFFAYLTEKTAIIGISGDNVKIIS